MSILASYSLSPLSKITNPDGTSQLKLVRDPDSIRVEDLLTNKTIPVASYDNLLTFRYADKNLELNGELLKRKTDKTYNSDLAKLSDNNLRFELAKEMYFDRKYLN